MKNLFNTRKRSIAAILTLCILLRVAGICVHATAMSGETTVATEKNIVVTEETTQELVPMMARECGEEDLYPLTNGYYGDPGDSGGAMRVMGGGYSGACAFFTYLTHCDSVVNMTTPIPGGGTARITPSNSAGSGYAVQIKTGGNQPFKTQRVHFD